MLLEQHKVLIQRYYAELWNPWNLALADERIAEDIVFQFAFDGKLALAGSNEDWADPNSQLWFVPATKDNYGIVYFGFGRGEYPPGGVSRRKLKIPEGGITKINPEDLYGLPQSGMDEKGLFFDGASTDVVQVPPARGKKTYDGRLEDLILRKCATVAEALKLLETYAFHSVQGQWLFADKTGDSFIIERGDVILRKNGNHQVMTNFLQSKVKPAEVTCPRYQLMTRTLSAEKDLSLTWFVRCSKPPSKRERRIRRYLTLRRAKASTSEVIAVPSSTEVHGPVRSPGRCAASSGRRFFTTASRRPVPEVSRDD